MKKIYKLSEPYIDNKEIRNVVKVLKSGWLTSGPLTLKLEAQIRKKIKTKNVIAVNSATSGIFICLVAMGAKKGDEVITPSNTYISTINTIYNLGLKISLCDIELSTGNVNEAEFSKKITKKTKFFIPIHNGGNPLNLNKLVQIAKKNKIKIIDDAATAFGSKINNKYVGSFNDTVTVFSLHANKLVTSGEGGFITTNNNKLAKKIRILINSGLDKDTWNRKNTKNYRILNVGLPGYKFNFNDILSSIAIIQIKKIDKIIKYRKKLKDRYLKKLNSLITNRIIEIPSVSKTDISALYNFLILFKKINVRDKVAKFLQKKKIYSTIHYTPAHKHSFYKKKLNGSNLINTNYFFKNSLSLPFHNNLTLRDIDFITFQIKKFFNEKK